MLPGNVRSARSVISSARYYEPRLVWVGIGVVVLSPANPILPARKNANMKITSRILIAIVALVALLQLPAFSQTAQPSIYAGLQSAFDLNNTNSLVNADEVNVSPLWKYDAEHHLNGAELKLDWWVTDQQGAFLAYEEYSNHKAFWSVGYQARTVFKGFEVSLGLGSRQSTDDPLGDVKMFLQPTITKQIWAKGNWDIRLSGGCDILNGAKPNPFFGLTFHAAKF